LFRSFIVFIFKLLDGVGFLLAFPLEVLNGPHAAHKSEFQAFKLFKVDLTILGGLAQLGRGVVSDHRFALVVAWRWSWEVVCRRVTRRLGVAMSLCGSGLGGDGGALPLLRRVYVLNC
jgi:hypothetical protein